VFQILGAKTWKALELKLRSWRGIDSNKVAEERIDLVGVWCCKRSPRYGGEPVCVKVAILNLTGSQVSTKFNPKCHQKTMATLHL